MSSRNRYRLPALLLAGLFCISAFAQSDHYQEVRQKLIDIGNTPNAQNADKLKAYRQLVAQSEETHDTLLQGEAINAIVGVFIAENRMDSVLSTYRKAARQVSAWGDTSLAAFYTLREVLMLKQMGEGVAAFDTLDRILPYLRQDPHEATMALQLKGELFYFVYYQLDSAMTYIDSALQIAYAVEDSVRLSSALEVRAGMLRLTGRYLEAIENTIEALSYVKQLNRLKKYILLDHISDIFKEIGQLDRAAEYAQRSLLFAEEQGFKRSAAQAHIALGDIYFEQGYQDLAIEHFQVARDYFDSSPETLEYLQVHTRLADVALQNGFPEAALGMLAVLSPERMPSLTNYVVAGYYLTYGRALGALHRDPQARQMVYQSLSIAEEMNDPRTLLPALKELRLIEERLGNSGAALEAADRYIALYDSTFTLQQTQLLFESESRYQRAEQDKAIAALNTENAVKDLNLRIRGNQLKYGIVALSAIALLSAYVFFLYRQVRSAKKLVEEQNRVVSKALNEKELLLKEIHHRVKNNLQVVSSLLSLQSRYIEDVQALEAIRQGRDRVKSMALIHQNLYQGENLTGIEVKPYFEKVIRGLFNSYNISPDQISIRLDVEEMMLDVDTIIPIGLIVNELISNALKYAFPDDRPGTISARLVERNKLLYLTVADDGIGMPEGWDEGEAASFGYRLIQAFREKLNADLILRNHDGTTVEMVIRDYARFD